MITSGLKIQKLIKCGDFGREPKQYFELHKSACQLPNKANAETRQQYIEVAQWMDTAD